MKYFFYGFCICLLISCFTKKNHRFYDYDRKVLGWKPIYGADIDYKKITYLPTAKPTVKPGKIYVYNNLIYQNEVGSGIHIINNSSPAAAQKVAFISIAGNTDIAIKGNYLYANNFMDMIVVDISNATNPNIVKRIKNVYNSTSLDANYPWLTPPESGYYECPKYNADSVIINWVKDSVQQYCRKL